jgi:hypothetical protein
MQPPATFVPSKFRMSQTTQSRTRGHAAVNAAKCPSKIECTTWQFESTCRSCLSSLTRDGLQRTPWDETIASTCPYVLMAAPSQRQPDMASPVWSVSDQLARLHCRTITFSVLLLSRDITPDIPTLHPTLLTLIDASIEIPFDIETMKSCRAAMRCAARPINTVVPIGCISKSFPSSQKLFT